MKKQILFIILLFTLAQCGYSPIYSKYNKDTNFEIVVNSLSGDGEINNLIKLNIDRASKGNSTRKFDIEVYTYYSKSILSKNKNGTISEYQLTATSDFTIKNGNKANTISFEEKMMLPAETNIFKEENYEQTIKNTFANSISKKFLLRLSTFK